MSARLGILMKCSAIYKIKLTYICGLHSCEPVYNSDSISIISSKESLVSLHIIIEIKLYKSAISMIMLFKMIKASVG